MESDLLWRDSNLAIFIDRFNYMQTVHKGFKCSDLHRRVIIMDICLYRQGWVYFRLLMFSYFPCVCGTWCLWWQREKRWMKKKKTPTQLKVKVLGEVPTEPTFHRSFFHLSFFIIISHSSSLKDTFRLITWPSAHKKKNIWPTSLIRVLKGEVGLWEQSGISKIIILKRFAWSKVIQ